jgi:hypothetical protein
MVANPLLIVPIGRVEQSCIPDAVQGLPGHFVAATKYGTFGTAQVEPGHRCPDSDHDSATPP